MGENDESAENDNDGDENVTVPNANSVHGSEVTGETGNIYLDA